MGRSGMNKWTARVILALLYALLGYFLPTTALVLLCLIGVGLCAILVVCLIITAIDGWSE
jgi:uncharacterized membrane protein HdeD (DUF308 family)